jgi:phosphatidylethanolamine-binding protein (PEBP) family uncharacterized protein
MIQFAFFLFRAAAVLLSVFISACGGGGGSSNVVQVTTPSTTSTPDTINSNLFTLTSTEVGQDGLLSSDSTCDGSGSSPSLTWRNPPSGTKSFALLMSTDPGDGVLKYNWVNYNLSATLTGLSKNSILVGTYGAGSDGPTLAYQPPCSQGPGLKKYKFTLYALSFSTPLKTSISAPTGADLLTLIANGILGQASIEAGYSRTSTSSGASAACQWVRSSIQVSAHVPVSVNCDEKYAYVSSKGLPSHTMMNGILATNLQVPTAQNFWGSNGWKIPLTPEIAVNPVSAVDGPIGVAVNGVPLFNPCKQGGCQNGDTKVLGELDVCNGHAGRADDYHYHAAPICLMATKPDSYWNTHPVGWALDGYGIFGFNNADGQIASRDGICGGNTSSVSNAPSGYSYHVTAVSPYILSCFKGVPSPDLANQASKFSPIRQPPVTPFGVSNMTLSTDSSDAYQVLEFTSDKSFTSTQTGKDSYANSPGTYKIRYKALADSDLEMALAKTENKGKSSCWAFQFKNSTGASNQPDVIYCK